MQNDLIAFNYRISKGAFQMNQVTKTPAIEAQLYNAERMATTIAAHLANRSRGMSRSEIAQIIGGDVSEVTLWRWLTRARDMGLVVMDGNTRNAKWLASDDSRRKLARNHLAQPIHKRPVMGYDASWLQEYTPNSNSYLSDKSKNRLNERCPIGSAPISEMNQHDLSIFMCGLPYASSRMEGNSYDYLSTVTLIETGQEMAGASKKETQMILNHHQATRYLIDNMSYPPTEGSISLTEREIRSLHSILSENLLKNPEDAGTLRKDFIQIQDSSYKPLNVPESIKSCYADIISKAAAIEDPFEQSFFLMIHLPYLQPFVDCNKRTARMACNIPLLRNGVIPMSWMDVEPQHFMDALVAVYELNDTSLMEEIFVDGYMRSVERFQIMNESSEPNEVSLRYRTEIKKSVRSRILNNDDSIPESVHQEDIPAFEAQVQEELDCLMKFTEAYLPRYRLRQGDIDAWLHAKSREGEVPRA